MEKRSFKRIDGRLWNYGTEERTDFKIKITRLARNGKLSPAGSLWLEVESIAKNQKAGILVKVGASEKVYLDTAAIIIRKFEGVGKLKKYEFEQKVENAVQQYKKNFFRRLIFFFKKLLKLKR